MKADAILILTIAMLSAFAEEAVEKPPAAPDDIKGTAPATEELKKDAETKPLWEAILSKIQEQQAEKSKSNEKGNTIGLKEKDDAMNAYIKDALKKPLTDWEGIVEAISQPGKDAIVSLAIPNSTEKIRIDVAGRTKDAALIKTLKSLEKGNKVKFSGSVQFAGPHAQGPYDGPYLHPTKSHNALILSIPVEISKIEPLK